MKALKKTEAKKISTVSQWIEAGGLATGWSPLTQVVTKESAKAIAIEGSRWNACATDRYRCLIWLPKSQLVAIEDDFYDQKIEGQNYLAPQWLLSAKQNEGFEFEAA